MKNNHKMCQNILNDGIYFFSFLVQFTFQDEKQNASNFCASKTMFGQQWSLIGQVFVSVMVPDQQADGNWLNWMDQVNS